MSKFLKHIACPNCGSRDNLGEYDDHFFCFGCKYYKLKTDPNSLRQLIKKNETVYTPIDKMELDLDIPKEAKQWLYKYGITPNEIKKYNFKWNPNLNMLMLLITKYYWQARVFQKDRPRYLSKGKKPLVVYGNGNSIVLVEDILSAIKISRFSPEMCASPLLGSTISDAKLYKICKKYDKINIWLDRDKAKEALSLVNLIRQKGKDSRVIITAKDPKEYTNKELNSWLNFK